VIGAMIDLKAVEKALPGCKFARAAHSEYQTLAGFVLKTLGRVPKQGEPFEAQG
jgi:CBS domain containing-hemolysin-like protein